MVFLFFGPVAVIGIYYLLTANLPTTFLFPAFSMGFLSTGVLNLNNMRDMQNDADSGKHTMAIMLGYDNAKIYHFLLVTIALTLAILFTILNFNSIWQFIYLITYPVFVKDIIAISRIQDNYKLDPYLKKLAFSTLLFTLLFGMGLVLS